ncbi:MAG: intein-containing RctB family protein [Nanoarchaeota archaeon]|nr:intein-containing RctB family protein [Nanoarchaeota archaeon]
MAIPKEIKKINDYVWELPVSYKKGMNVPARIIVSEEMLKAVDDGVFDQVTNVACMPGIQKYSICMPDCHWGYGMPIGGVAAFDLEKGVISPGAIGFDINCLTKDSKILLNYGCYKKIKNFDNNFESDKISFMDLNNNSKKSSNAVLYMKKMPDNRVIKITTKSGEEITVTEDHPIYTGKEMINAGELNKGDNVVVHPFIGVEYSEPSDKIIVDEKDIIALVGDRPKLIVTLKEKGLLPLRENSDKLPILTKLLGFIMGDGWIGKNYNKNRKQDVWSTRVIGSAEDLETVRTDIRNLGYVTNYVTTKKYDSIVSEISGEKRNISGKSTQLYVNSQSFTVLLKALGMTEGNKSKNLSFVPEWVKESPLWIKRLYLAGLFGAEMTKPCQRKGEYKSFTEPSFSQNKILELWDNNYEFITDIINMLSEFGVEVNNIYNQKGVINKYGETTGKIAFRISAKIDNLINLWSKVGYEYCKKRKELSMQALSYLKMKRVILKESDLFVEEMKLIHNEGANNGEISILAQQNGHSVSQVLGRLYSNSKSSRACSDFPTFQQFIEKHTILNSEFVLDEITDIEEINYRDYVYDFTMNDENHNFIANSIVTSNCGMRLITTNLTLKEVKPKIKQLVDHLYMTVPSGVGCKGFLKLNDKQFDDIMVEGTKWCVDNGYGWDKDVWRTESYGKIEGADPQKVSQRARSRGINQLGTLGSGNHYLEIQVALKENIFDPVIASKFGINKEDQVVIMVHCGSRGFGHQIATDYLKIFNDAMGKYNIKVYDRELACAPFKSKEGQDYFSAMACAANMAFANRQMITHRIREGFSKVFGKSPQELEMNLVYDVAHNIAKIEEHMIDGKMKKVLVHRKGATRAFPPKHRELNPEYRPIGQPVILGGSMETGSHLLVGTQKAMDETFGSTAHGSGRTMSRTKAKKEFEGKSLLDSMIKKGIYVRSGSMKGLAEEAGGAYKNINQVVGVLDSYGITKKVVGLKPIGNVKG